MARAITGIDEDLISDAHTVQGAKAISWKKPCALAACLALIVAAAFLFRPGTGTTIRVSGQKLTAKAVTVEQGNQPAVARVYSLEPVITFTVPLEIEVRGHTVISVSGGSLQVFDVEGSSLLYEGETFGTEEGVRILWTVENDGTAAQFEMIVDGGKTANTVILTCDGSGEWKIRKASN